METNIVFRYTHQSSNDFIEKKNFMKKETKSINMVLFKEEGLYTVDFQCPPGIRVEIISLFSLNER